jgi:protein-S-isoprenylcysteine O-methyltransferase Ste14
MKLLDHFTHSGDRLFHWRGELPLLLLPFFVAALADSPWSVPPTPAARAMQAVAVLVALAGLGVRVVAVGTAPRGTSERSTTNPRASMLRTTGVYSLVRHPLYIGNTLTAVGLAAFTGTWYLPLVVLLAGVLYHERICAREEAFLEGRFGDEFREWADRVPAAIPGPARYVRSATPFVWRRVLGREFHGLMVIASAVFVLDLGRAGFATGRLVFDPLWTGFFVVTTAIFLFSLALKRLTNVFREDDSRPAPTP